MVLLLIDLLLILFLLSKILAVKAFNAGLHNLHEDHKQKGTWCIWRTEEGKRVIAELQRANRREKVSDIGRWTEARQSMSFSAMGRTNMITFA